MKDMLRSKWRYECELLASFCHLLRQQAVAWPLLVATEDDSYEQPKVAVALFSSWGTVNHIESNA